MSNSRLHASHDIASSAWTPGPWHVAYDDHNGQAVVSSAHTEIATCWHHCVGSIEKEMRHNARLIAAAPEMFEALYSIAVLVNAGTIEGLTTKAVEAIGLADTLTAKARGEQVQP